jgi:Protein of unknown function (DUF3568)
MKTERFSLIHTALLATGLLVAVAGCSTVNLDSTGDTQAVYQLNEFKMVVNSTAPVTYAATQKAFRSMDIFETTGSKLDTFAGELIGRTRKDEKVFVSIAEINSRQTVLKIRWSSTGDKKNSTDLYKLIERNLH